MLRPRILVLTGLVVAPAGCTLVDAQAEVREVCATYAGLQLPAADLGATVVDQSFVVNQLDAIQSLAGLVSDLEFVRAQARATSGIAGFEFVEAAHIAVSSGDPSSYLPTIDVYDCDGDCKLSGNSLTLPSRLSQSAIDYVKSGSVVVEVLLVGQPPTAAWSMDVDVCFRGHLRYQLGI